MSSHDLLPSLAATMTRHNQHGSRPHCYITHSPGVPTRGNKTVIKKGLLRCLSLNTDHRHHHNSSQIPQGSK
ncbi:hypothetical protein E2C01_085936 [Portunus trituberculatus]|uniref:Uncharacterized protein n=1 Tax=Portunus trituberculatus TaxID=210409 RepID=A0A5B7J456_PORTR|nr:hypothetical protein [Portunus trituberculatus]